MDLTRIVFLKKQMLKETLPFLVAFSITFRRSSFTRGGLSTWRSSVSGWSAWTLWRGPRTRPFTFNLLMLSNFSSSPFAEKRKKRSDEVWSVKPVQFFTTGQRQENICMLKVRRSEREGTWLGRHFQGKRFCRAQTSLVTVACQQPRWALCLNTK